MDNSIPKISIIVPVYGVEKYLGECVQSLVNQTLQDIEIILVDDESPDCCPEMCDEYAQRDPRIKVIHKKNAGLGYARNSGLEIATGEYVAFLDSDDYIDLDTYEKLCRIADENHLDKVRFICNRFKDNGEHSALEYSGKLSIYSSPEDMKQLALCIFDRPAQDEGKALDFGGSSCMAIYRHAIIKKYNLKFVSEREYISEDYIFNFYFYMNSQRVGYWPNTFYHYRVNMLSLTRTIRLDRIGKIEAYSQYVSQLIMKFNFPLSAVSYSIGYYVNGVRASVRAVFMSHYPISEKKKWFKAQLNSKYFKEACYSYPRRRLTFKQRICLWTMEHRWFYLSYILIVGFSTIRFNRYK